MRGDGIFERRGGREPLALCLAALALILAHPSPAVGAGEPELTGPLTREQIEAAVPDWVEAEIAVEPDAEAAARLAQVAAELGERAKVEVYLGTWCSDSRRELTRLWRHLDEAGAPPLTLEYLGFARDPTARPREVVDAVDLRFVPTFVVRLDGREVGRIVESSPAGVERDLAALLAGEAAGLLTGRDDLDAD